MVTDPLGRFRILENGRVQFDPGLVAYLKRAERDGNPFGYETYAEHIAAFVEAGTMPPEILDGIRRSRRGPDRTDKLIRDYGIRDLVNALEAAGLSLRDACRQTGNALGLSAGAVRTAWNKTGGRKV